MQGMQQHEPANNDSNASQLVPVAGPPATRNSNLYSPSSRQLEPPNHQLDLGQTLRQYVQLLRKYKWLYVAICSLFLSAAWAYVTMRTPLYSATVRIQINRAYQDILKQNTAATIETSASDYLRTQYALLGSRTMARRVAVKLSLARDQKFLAPRHTSWTSVVGLLSSAIQTNKHKKQAQPLQSAAITIVTSNVAIRPVPGSRLVDIRYKDPSPARAQRIADAYAAAYIASNIDRRIATSRYASEFLNEQIKNQRKRLETSERTLLQFAKQAKVIATSEQSSIAEERLSAANDALGRLISERIKNQQLWEQVKTASSILMPQFLGNPTIDQLRGRRKALKNEYQEKLDTFKPDYPTMRRIQRTISEVDRQLTAEAKAIRASFKAAYQNSASQEKEMRAQIHDLRAEVLSLKNKQIRYDILKRDADSNRTLYDDLLRRFKEIDVGASTRANNIYVVDRAQIPSAPSEPRRSRILLLAMFLGFGASTLLAYTIEILDDRIHTPEEAEQLTGLLTIGSIPKGTRKTRLFESKTEPSRSTASEAYRSLASALQFATHSGLPRSITVTSTGRSEGKSTTSLALTRHFATLGYQVLLIDGNLQNPTLHDRLKTKNSAGLSCYLTGTLEPSDVIQRTDLANLSFIASGPPRPTAADHLAGAQLQRLIAAGLDVFDLILLDGPPVASSTDAIFLSNATSATLFVVACNEQRKSAVRDAIRRLHLVGSLLAGTVLTNYDNRLDNLS